MDEQDKNLANEVMADKEEFLPDDYEVPQGPSKYMSFEVGENKFRILSSPILGYEYWTNEIVDGKKTRKPNRVTMDTPLTDDMIDDEGNFPKHFWAMVVWNYQAKKVQILEITQKGIQKSLRALAKSKSWGSPKEFNIVVTREGEGLETKYTTQPEPKTKLTDEQKKAFKDTYINLEALFEGEDPFTKE